MRTALLLITAAVAGPVLANDSINTTTSGKGKATIDGGKDFDIRRVTLQFYRDSHFRVFFDGENYRSISGTYRRQGGRRYRLEVETAFNNSDSSGTGWVELESGDLIKSLEINGRSNRSGFRIFFAPEDEWSGGSGSWGSGGGSWGGSGGSWGEGSGSGSTRGTGNLSYKGDNDRLTTLNASYTRDGRVRLEFGGEARFTVEAEAMENDRISIRSINGIRSSGSGYANNITNSKAVVNLSGTYKGERISISYRASSGGSGGSGGWGGSGGSWDGGRDPESFGPATFRGTGTLSYKNDRDPIDVVTVTFDRNGRFRLSFGGDAKGTFEGTYRVRGGTYSLHPTRLAGSDMSGSGAVSVDRDGNVTSASVSGRYKGASLSFIFRSR